MSLTTPLTSAEASTPLLLSLSGVAELARVRRPVVSMWRSRFSSGEDAFPSPVARGAGAPLFDAAEVAGWLVRTDHGNNPDAVADAAASAAPVGLDWADPAHVAELDALIALSAQLGGLADVAPDELVSAARETDPDDTCLQSDVRRHLDRGANWSRFTDDLIDAAYAPAGALRLTSRRRAAMAGGEGSASTLSPTALELVVAVTTALAHNEGARQVILDRGIDDEAALGIARTVTDEVAVAVMPSARERSIRRRFLVDGLWLDDVADDLRGVRVARVPVAPDHDIDRMLADAEDVGLSLSGDDAAVFVGPARALIDTLPPAAAKVRDDVLRSGRLRAAVRLPQGLVSAAPREALALWVLGAPTGDVPLDARFTTLIDLIDNDLTSATRADLVSDVLAGMGSAAAVRARTFRFARLVRTASLLARSGALLAPRAPRATTTPASTVAARLDAAARAAGPDIPSNVVTAMASVAPVTPATLEDLVSAGHARILAGTRLAAEDLGDTGLTVVTADDLDATARIGRRRIDPLTLAQRYPAAQLTRPGDVVFRTSPTTAAWVDHDGSHVVAYPARVIRVTAADPGGLVPELVAADIPAQPAGPGAWKRWMLRRVAPASIAPLRRALRDLAAARSELESRIADLDHYTDTLTAAVAAGAVTITEPDAAAAVSDPQ